MGVYDGPSTYFRHLNTNFHSGASDILVHVLRWYGLDMTASRSIEAYPIELPGAPSQCIFTNRSPAMARMEPKGLHGGLGNRVRLCGTFVTESREICNVKIDPHNSK